MNPSKRPATTLTAASERPHRPGDDPLVLAWLFPRTSDPALPLDFPAGVERVIGREEGVAVCLPDGNVSRRHARIQRVEDGYELVDLESRNGTRVNGRSVQTARLGVGDVVRVGDSVGLVTAHPGVPTELAPGLHAGALLQAELAPARRAAPSDLPIIVEGETGTGKEVAARAIHLWSGRPGPFVAVNCAALPEALAEGELFGYRRGAFTGADRASPGFFRSAEGGTLLLDEVVDLPLVIQAKLLRVLEQKEVQPLGESRPVAVDVRVIVAAQAPLEAAVERQEFRGDLLARLDGVSVRLPPLRERVGDVPALFQRLFAAENAGVAAAVEADFVERLCLYDWPFNVREVVLLARRLRVLCDPHRSLRAYDLPRRMQADALDANATNGAVQGSAAQGSTAQGSTATTQGRQSDEPVELPALLSALRACRGNVAQAAAALGISRPRAYRLMQGHDVDLDAVRRGDPERSGDPEPGGP